VDPKAEEVMRSIVKTAGYMTNMVRDYLDLSRIETGEMRYELQDGVRFVKDVLGFASDNTHLWAEQRGSRITLDVPGREILVRGDLELLRILMTNLVDNAVKYGFDGIEVKVSAKVEGGRLEVSVRNPGVGFTEEAAGKLFKRFSRLRQKGVEDRKGSGLGLYLCWYIAQKHGGSLTASSKPGEWAEFALKLPDARLE
jgi:signal transduction histidine kinase